MARLAATSIPALSVQNAGNRRDAARLDLAEMVVMGVEQCLRRLDRRGRQCGAPRIGRLEMPQKGRGPARKTFGLFVEVAMEAPAPGRVQVGLPHEDVGGGADGRRARQDLMHRFGQNRVMGEPVAQPLDRRLQVADALALLRDQRGPARKPRGHVVDAVGFGPAAGRFAPARGGGAQRVVDRRIRPVRQHAGFHPQRACQPDQQLASDPSAVVLDQVEIGRRNPRRLRQRRLLHAHQKPAVPDAGSRQLNACVSVGKTGHRRPRSFLYKSRLQACK
jgi:hypothetical protein